MKKYIALLKARNIEFVRNKEDFFWNLIFPVLLIAGFSYMFSGAQQSSFTIGLLGNIPTEDYPLVQMRSVNYVDYNLSDNTISKQQILDRIRFHQIDMLIDFDSGVFYLNEQSTNAEILRSLVELSQYQSQIVLNEKQVSGKAIRYVDWLVPGIIGMNMLFSCLFGVGYGIVRYRKTGVLKRLKATPISSFGFVSAQMVSRFIIVFITSIIVFVGTDVFINFMILGSYLNLLLLTGIAVLCMNSLGLLFASRLKSEELLSGIMDVVEFFVIMLSGVFFSLEGKPLLMRQISRFIPLTHYIEGARKIMLEGSNLLAIMPNLLSLSAITLVFLILAGILFRWE